MDVLIVVSTFTKGEQMVPVLNKLDVRCAVYGNHDFGKLFFDTCYLDGQKQQSIHSKVNLANFSQIRIDQDYSKRYFLKNNILYIL